ncbi:MAG: hypothetical protein V2A58_00105 [Planctomycetota bacterium]
MKVLKQLGVALILLVVSASFARAADGPFGEVARVVPGDVQVYIELRDIAALRQAWQGSSVLARLRETEMYREAVSSPGYNKFETGLAELEKQYGFTRDDAVKDLLGGTVGLAIRFTDTAPTPTTLLAVTGPTAGTLDRYAGIVSDIQEKDGKLKSSSGSTYGDYKITTKVVVKQNRAGELFDKTEHQVITGNKFLASNDLDFLKQALDRLADPKKPSVATNERLAAAASALPAGASAILVADMPPVTQRFLSKSGLGAKVQNPIAKNILFTLRGYLESLSTQATGVYVKDTVRIVSQRLYSPEKITPSLRKLISSSASGAEALAILPPGTLGCLDVNFEPGALVAYLRDVLPPEGRERLEAVLETAKTFTASPDASASAPEVLGGELTLAVSREGEGAPGVALILSLANPEVTRPRLEGAIGATVAWIAVDQRKKGNAFEIKAENVGESVVRSFGPVGPGGRLTPAYAFVGKYLVFSSSREFVREIALTAASPASGSLARKDVVSAVLTGGQKPTRVLYVDIAQLGKVMEEHKGALVAHHMRKKGGTIEKARAEVDKLIEMVKLGGWLRASTTCEEGKITTVLELAGRE